MILSTEKNINNNLLYGATVASEQPGIEKTWLDTVKTVSMVLLKIVLFPWGICEAVRWYYQKNDLAESIKRVEIDGVTIPCHVKNGTLFIQPINKPILPEVEETGVEECAIGPVIDDSETEELETSEPIQKRRALCDRLGRAYHKYQQTVAPYIDDLETEELETSEPIRERRVLCAGLGRTYQKCQQKYQQTVAPYVEKALKGHRVATMGSSVASFAVTVNHYVEGLSVERMWEIADTIDEEAPLVFICMQCSFVILATYAAYRYLG